MYWPAGVLGNPAPWAGGCARIHMQCYVYIYTCILASVLYALCDEVIHVWLVMINDDGG